MLIRCPAGASNIHGWVFVPQPMLDCVDQLSTPVAAAAAMCSGLDATDTVHERSGSTTTILLLQLLWLFARNNLSSNVN